MSFKIHKKLFHELTTQELYEIVKLRIEVFMIEQRIIAQDLDDFDQRAVHYFVKNFQEEIISYARVFIKNIKFEEASIGRICTKKNYRNQKIATSMMEDIILDLGRHQMYDIKISAQVTARNFYEKFGFKQVSDPYLEEGIEHVEMIKTKHDV